MRLGVQCIRKNLQAVHESRSWAAEVVGAARYVHATGANGRQILPPFDRPEQGEIDERSLHAEPATGDEYHLRLPVYDLRPPQRA